MQRRPMELTPRTSEGSEGKSPVEWAYSSVVAVNLSLLGDLVSSYGVLSVLQGCARRVAVLVKPQFRCLVGGTQGLVAVTEDECRAETYDLAVDLTGTREARGVIRRLRAKERLGFHKTTFDRIRFFLGGTYTRSVFSKSRGHIVADFEPLMGLLGAQGPILPRVRLRTEVVQPLSEVVPVAWARRAVVGLHMAASQPKRSPPLGLLSEMVEMVSQRGGRTLLVGSEAEMALELQKRHGEAVFFRPASVLEMASDLSQLSCVIGPDSGVVHLTAALGVPTLVLFGPTPAKAFRPLGDHVEVVEAQLACRPCRWNIDDCEDRQCFLGLDRTRILSFISRHVGEVPHGVGGQTFQE